jgi:hypothetical protein
MWHGNSQKVISISYKRSFFSLSFILSLALQKLCLLTHKHKHFELVTIWHDIIGRLTAVVVVVVVAATAAVVVVSITLSVFLSIKQ